MEHMSPEPDPDPDSNNSRAQPYILLVQSDPDVAQVTRAFLQAEGYKVHTEMSARDATLFLVTSISDGRALPAVVLFGDLADEESALQFLDHIDALNASDLGAPVLILCTTQQMGTWEKMPRRIRAIGISVHPLDGEGLTHVVGVVLKAVDSIHKHEATLLGDEPC